MPGSPLDPRCRGTNDLLRRGAVLTETADDVVAAIEHQLAPGPGPRAPRPPAREPAAIAGSAELASAMSRVLECLSPSPVAVDALIRDCDLPAAVVTAVLLDLELAGRLERQAGQCVALLA